MNKEISEQDAKGIAKGLEDMRCGRSRSIEEIRAEVAPSRSPASEQCPDCESNDRSIRFEKVIAGEVHNALCENPWHGDGAAGPGEREALLKLRNEVRGLLGMEKLTLRALIGNTNFNVLQLRVDEATAALESAEARAAVPQAPAREKELEQEITRLKLQYTVASCYWDDDNRHESPEEFADEHNLKLGTEFELQAATYWEEKFRVTVVPDASHDDYVCETISQQREEFPTYQEMEAELAKVKAELAGRAAAVPAPGLDEMFWPPANKDEVNLFEIRNGRTIGYVLAHASSLAGREIRPTQKALDSDDAARAIAKRENRD